MEQKHFHFNEKKRVVVKIGSSSLNYGETGNLNFTKLEHLVRELCNLRNRGMDVCLVSSGAIAVGRQTLGMDERPKDISTKQACAAVGQARLMMIYQRLFAEYNQVAGQAERQDEMLTFLLLVDLVPVNHVFILNLIFVRCH